VGNKWSLSALQAHFKNLGIDLELMWSKVYDAVLKSIISVEKTFFEQSKKLQNNSTSVKSNCFELFGYDILLDSDLKPWILEVNLAPSLTADSPVDFHIKSNLLVDMFNLVGVRRMPGKRPRKPSKAKPSDNTQRQAEFEFSMNSNGANTAHQLGPTYPGGGSSVKNSTSGYANRAKVGLHPRGAAGGQGAAVSGVIGAANKQNASGLATI
jgi:hypothetical protein